MVSEGQVADPRSCRSRRRRGRWRAGKGDWPRCRAPCRAARSRRRARCGRGLAGWPIARGQCDAGTQEQHATDRRVMRGRSGIRTGQATAGVAPWLRKPCAGGLKRLGEPGAASSKKTVFLHGRGTRVVQAHHLPLRSLFPCDRAPVIACQPDPHSLVFHPGVNYWCQTLNRTETRLRNALLVVGPLVADVRVYFARQRPKCPSE